MRVSSAKILKYVVSFKSCCNGVAAMRALSRVASFKSCCNGVAAMEFAMLAPFLLLMGFGSFEVTRYLLAEQKTDKVAYIIADVVSQSTASTLTATELNETLTAATKVMEPFTFGASGYVIITSVSRANPNPQRVSWQYSGGGTMTRTSAVGTTVGANATLPGAITIADRENVIVVEVFYRYSPLFAAGYVRPLILYRTAIFKPRLGALTTAPT